MNLAGGWKEVGRFTTAAGQSLAAYRRGAEFCLSIEDKDEERSMDLDLTPLEAGTLADWIEDVTTEAGE